MTQLSDLHALGFAAPYLGPWFSATTADPDHLLSLPAPGEDLGTALPDLSDDPGMPDLMWQAPTLGRLGYALSGPDAPLEVLRLRAPDGTRLFAGQGRFVAHFRIHAGVAHRLQQLWAALPPATAQAAQNDRPFPASLTMSLPFLDGPDDPVVAGMVVPPVDEQEMRQTLGLTSVAGEARASLTHGYKGPMAIMPDLGPTVAARPQDPVTAATLLRMTLRQSQQATLYAHDAQGAPMDPGMVAAQFLALVTRHPELMPEIAPGIATPTPPRPRDICVADPGLSIHVSAAAGGVLSPEHLSRIAAERTDGSVIDGATLMTLDDPAAALTLAPGGTGDPRSEPLVAGVMPSGALLPEPRIATLSAPLDRDQLRLGILAHEALLTGLGANERQQEFPTSRIAVARARASIGTTGADAGGALIDCLQSGAARLAAEIIDPDFGAPQMPSDPQDLPGDLTPDDLRPHLTLSLRHVLGTGALDGNGFVTGQSVLASLSLDPATLPAEVTPPAAGTPVRAYLHSLDPKTGRLAYLPNGCGRWRDAGALRVLDVVLSDLPGIDNGAEPPTLAFDLAMPAPDRPRLLRDLRGPRPAFVGGDALAALSTAGDLLHVESGRLARGPVAPGETVLATPDSAPQLVVPETASGHGPGSVAQSLRANHRLVRFPAPQLPDPRVDLATLTGASVIEIGSFETGGGLTGRHRGTYAASASQAVLSTAPASARLMGDAPLSAPFQTVKGAPALQMSVTFDGPALTGYTQALHGMMTPDPVALVQDAPPPADIDAPTDPGAQIAILRNCGPGGEGSQFGALLGPLDTFDVARNVEAALADLKAGAPSELAAVITQIEGLIAGQAHRARAIHRRLLAAQGTAEFAQSLVAAIANAEHEVILASETFSDGSALNPLGAKELREALEARLGANPTLHVIAMIPDRVAAAHVFDPHTTRDDGATQWLAPLQARAPDRVVALRSAGPLRSRLRGFGSFVAIDGLSAWILPGGLSPWGLERNSALGLALLGEALEDGRAPLIDRATRDLMAWFLGVAPAALPVDWSTLAPR